MVPPKKVIKLCSEPGCDRPLRVSGRCHRHYGRDYGRALLKARREEFLRTGKHNNAERLAYQRAWRAKNKDREREYKKTPKQKALRKFMEKQREVKKRARDPRALPKWADRKAIRSFYENRPEGRVVDHIIPLKGDIVSGLHVVENLQYLTHSENSKKKNHFNPEEHQGRCPNQKIPSAD